MFINHYLLHFFNFFLNLSIGIILQDCNHLNPFFSLPFYLETLFFNPQRLNQTSVSAKNSNIPHLCGKKLTKLPPSSLTVKYFFSSRSDTVHVLFCVLKSFSFILTFVQITLWKKSYRFTFFCPEYLFCSGPWPSCSPQYLHLLFSCCLFIYI